jgi:outer membrane immunogenic protein
LPIYKAPPPVVAPSISWSGCYVGVNGGGGWAKSDFTSGRGSDEATAGVPARLAPGATLGGLPGTEVDTDLRGGVFGGHVGCQYQWANWVFGVEVGADGADIHGSTTANISFAPFNPAAIALNSYDTKVKWLATATPRLGFAWGPWMYYVKGGLAAAQDDVTLTRVGFNPATNGLFVSDTESRVGWTVGTGLEWMFAPGWILGVEYNYIDLGTDFHGDFARSPTGATPDAFSFLEDHKLRINEVLGRLSYKFSWGGGSGSY